MIALSTQIQIHAIGVIFKIVDSDLKGIVRIMDKEDCTEVHGFFIKKVYINDLILRCGTET